MVENALKLWNSILPKNSKFRSFIEFERHLERKEKIHKLLQNNIESCK